MEMKDIPGTPEWIAAHKKTRAVQQAPVADEVSSEAEGEKEKQ